ncbi:hypothetical protein VOLCADRAFT_31665, partial [Volvox carteri f. nagariensis]
LLPAHRPRALNSLNLGMVSAWLEFSRRGESPVAAVVVRGAGGKAFCAGGDVKEVVLRARAGDWSYGTAFFRTEYVNNAAIAQLPVPYIAVIDGITMGGGVGVSYHGHFRVATERTVLAMPESGIGLFPDVGASFFLHRLPGHLGRYMGLTGQRLMGAEVKDAGFATHFIPSARLPDLDRGVLELGPRAADLSLVDALLRSLEPPPSAAAAVAAAAAAAAGTDNNNNNNSSSNSSALLEWKLPLINVHFGRRTVAEVVAGSPLSHAVTWEMLRRSAAGHMTLQQCLEMEFLLARRFVAGEADFLEGVRALLIDKDNKPRWRYGSVKEVPELVVQRLFEPLVDE